jgi:hypothetical protein
MLHRVGNAGWIVNNRIYRSDSPLHDIRVGCARHHGHGTYHALADGRLLLSTYGA